MPKPNPPTLRDRNRYIAFTLRSEGGLDKRAVVRLVNSSVGSFLGEAAAGETGLWLIEWDEKTKRGILRTTHKTVDKVRAALTLAQKYEDKKITYQTLGVSGTIKKTREKFL